MKLPDPIFIGFRAKEVTAPSGFGVPEVCSMSDCVNDMPPNWIERWDWNRASCYNSEEEAQATIPIGTENRYVLFAYRMYPVEYAPGGHIVVDLDNRLAQGKAIAQEPDLSSFCLIGYDVANGPTYDPEDYPWQEGFAPYGGNLGFGHSPLSCNGCAHEFLVNQYYLLDNVNTAVSAAETFGVEQPEPGSYFIYEVLRKSHKEASI